VLLDLGLSSMQVDRPERGFSYAIDAPLDMRMDPSEELSAAAVVGTWDERELETIFRRYGEERYARQIARGIVRRRRERSSAPASWSTSFAHPFPHQLDSVRGIRPNASSGAPDRGEP
jgi:16S rRNA C1402 N4-methylase RsmH